MTITITKSSEVALLKVKRRSTMSAKGLLSGLFALTASGFALLSPEAAVAQAPAAIQGKQCVFNNAAYSVNVEWYEPGVVVYKGGDVKDKNNYTIPADAKVAQSDKNITVGLKSCTNVANRVAVVKIVGHSIANDLIIIGGGTVVGVATAVGGAFACAGTVGAGCVALAAVGPAAGGTIAALRSAMPDVQEIAYIGAPGTRNYLDVSGSIWNVGIANTVPLSRARGFSVLTDWVDGGERGAKSITFNNQSGYVAEMSLMYWMKQERTGIPIPVFKGSGKVSLGFSRHIEIPVESANMPITVTVTGVATTKNPVFTTTVPGNFSGNKCFKSFGTIFNAQGSAC